MDPTDKKYGKSIGGSPILGNPHIQNDASNSSNHQNVVLNADQTAETIQTSAINTF
jgi:hypothetical protein